MFLLHVCHSCLWTASEVLQAVRNCQSVTSCTIWLFIAAQVQPCPQACVAEVHAQHQTLWQPSCAGRPDFLVLPSF